MPRRRSRKGRIIALVAASLIVLTVVGLWLYADHALHRVDAIGDYPGRPAAGAFGARDLHAHVES